MIIKDIETATSIGSTYDIEDMIRELDRVHKDLHGKESDDEKEGEKATDHAMANVHQTVQGPLSRVWRNGT